eukprot:106080-Chlamydomonas_euryale.AAC.1
MKEVAPASPANGPGGALDTKGGRSHQSKVICRAYGGSTADNGRRGGGRSCRAHTNRVMSNEVLTGKEGGGRGNSFGVAVAAMEKAAASA